jgi:hypothetical protein
MKAAYANMVGYRVQETRVARLFRPMYAQANMGQPSYTELGLKPNSLSVLYGPTKVGP